MMRLSAKKRLATLCLFAAVATSHADNAWKLPKWIANDQPIQGEFNIGSEVSNDSVRIRYQINDGESRDVESSNVADDKRTIAFSLPKLPYATFGFVKVWAEDKDSGESISRPRTIAIADWREFDISGVTDVELLFPMQSWGMQVRFTPCCLINAGYLRVERVPINPTKDATGLPKTLASEFLHLAPDPTVVATAGLNADIEIDSSSALAKTPEDVTVYEWYKGRWIPVLGAELHGETNTIRFPALEGGYFVLGAKTSQ
jgi:hypothetical protein